LRAPGRPEPRPACPTTFRRRGRGDVDGMVDTTASFPVLLDLDGTLVDSVFHHVLAWDGALSAYGVAVPLWRIHEAIGMGGSRLVPHLVGHVVDDVDELKEDHEQ